MQESSKFLSEKELSIISILPASILERSRISFTKLLRVMAERLNISKHFSCSLSNLDKLKISPTPRIAFNGVRIS